MKKRKLWRGFTLVEMLVVLLILGILILVVVPNLGKHRSTAQTVGDEATIKTIETQMELYRIEFPTDADVTVDDLVKEGYIDEKQMKQYNEAVERQKAPPKESE